MPAIPALLLGIRKDQTFKAILVYIVYFRPAYDSNEWMSEWRDIILEVVILMYLLITITESTPLFDVQRLFNQNMKDDKNLISLVILEWFLLK